MVKISFPPLLYFLTLFSDKIILLLHRIEKNATITLSIRLDSTLETIS